MLLLLPTLLVACPEPEPFDVSIVNNSSDIQYMDGPRSGGQSFEIDRDGEWKNVTPNGAFLCLRTCGQPGPVVCAMADIAVFGVGFVLLFA